MFAIDDNIYKCSANYYYFIFMSNKFTELELVQIGVGEFKFIGKGEKNRYSDDLFKNWDYSLDKLKKFLKDNKITVVKTKEELEIARLLYAKV